MKNTAHNLNEVKALTKEAITSGDDEKFNGCSWYNHEGDYICRTFTGADMFHLELPNVTLETVRIKEI